MYAITFAHQFITCSAQGVYTTHEPHYLCGMVKSSKRSTLLRRGELLIWGGWYQSGRLSIVIGTTKLVKNPNICMGKERALTTEYV